MSGGERILLVTGAAGFLGARIVAAGLAEGFRVRAAARSERSAAEAPWSGRANVDAAHLDLSEDDAEAKLGELADGAAAVIHAAGALRGDDARHERDTVAPTRKLVAAVAARRAPPRFVLVSSASVYNYASMPAGATLDETAPCEPEPHLRDAYCRAKLAQEALVVAAAQRMGLCARIMRPGAIVGPGRLRSARLGFALGPALLRVGDPPVPAVDVSDCAAALARAAATPVAHSDAPVTEGGGAVEFINVAAIEQSPVSSYLESIRPAGWPRFSAAAPAALARAPAQIAALADIALPGLARRLPGPLRLETFDARFKPLRYSVARLEDRLGLRFERAFAAAAEPS